MDFNKCHKEKTNPLYSEIKINFYLKLFFKLI